jgi:hypothetical protein
VSENQNGLIDRNLYEVIINCRFKHKRIGKTEFVEIFVLYENGREERIWTYNTAKYSFDPLDFIGMTKIEAIFYCDRKKLSGL